MSIVLGAVEVKRTTLNQMRPMKSTLFRLMSVAATFFFILITSEVLSSSPAYAATTPKLSVVSAPESVPYGGSTSATISVSNSSGSSLEVYETLYPKITSRTALLSMTPTSVPSGYPISISPPTPLSSLKRSGESSYGLTLSIGNSSSAVLNISGCSTSCSGNYPLQIRLANSQTGVVYSEITVPLTVVAAKPSKALGVSFVVHYISPSFNSHTFHTVIAFLSTHSSLPLSLIISPSLLVNAQSSVSPSVRQDLVLLEKWSQLAGHSVVTTTYVPVDPTCISTLGGSISYKSQIQNGASVLQSYERSSAAKVFATTGSDVPETLDTPRQIGFTHILIPQAYLDNLAFNVTPTAPVTLRSSSVSLLGVDSVLTREFSTANTSMRRALSTADLSQIYFDAPNDPSQRAIVVSVNISNATSMINFSSSLRRVLTDPLTGLVSLNTAFSIPSHRSVSMSRLNLASTATKSCRRLPRSELGKGAQYLQTVTSLNTNISNRLTLERYLLDAESAALTKPESEALIVKAKSLAKEDFHSVSVVTNSSFTLTSRKTTIPVTVTSKLKLPVSVRLELKSLKLEFPQGNVKDVTLNHPTSTISFPVAVKTLGSFPLQIVVQAPNGVTITTSTVRVNSEAFSIVGVALTLGSLGVFLIWWARSISRKRRSRRPAGSL